MKSWCLLVLLGLFAACGQNDSIAPKHAPTVNELIQGSWVTHIIDSSSGTWRSFSLNFEDSFVYLNSLYEQVMKFEIDDSVLTLIPTNSASPMSAQRIGIIEVNSNSIKLLPSPTKWQGIRGLLGSNCKDTLAFTRISKKNDLEPIKIAFVSSTCFGECPSMQFEIDKDRKMRFFGGLFTELEGGYSGRLTQPIYDRILAQIRAIPLTALNSEYKAPSADHQTCYLELNMRDTAFYVRSYGNYLQPYELTIVYRNLMSLYKHVSLEKDTTVTRLSLMKNH